MSNSRHYSIDHEHTNNHKNGPTGPPSSFSAPSLPDQSFSVKDWLKKAKLLDYLPIFNREKITIEELILFNDKELLQIANETLHLNVLHRKRFINAMNDTKRILNTPTTNTPNNSSNNSSNLYSLSSSQLPYNSYRHSHTTHTHLRPLSPALSIHSTHSSPMDTEYSHNNHSNNHSPKKSPLISSNYNGNSNYNSHTHYKSTNKFSKHRQRRHTLPDKEAFFGRKHISSNSLDDIEAMETDNKNIQGRPPFKIIRKRSQKMISTTPTLTSIKQYNKKNRNNSIPIIFDENNITENGSENNGTNNSSLKRMSLNSSSDENNSSNNDIHSEDEKWDELELNNTKEQKENIKTISVLLEENKADANQIENGIKLLNKRYNECYNELKEYFSVLQNNLNSKYNEYISELLTVKNNKLGELNNKIYKLEENENYILESKSNNTLIDMNIINDNIIDINENESQIRIEFNEIDKDLFYNNICIIKEYILPHCPKIKIKNKNEKCITIKIIIMNTKEKKDIKHSPHSNRTKNTRINTIEIEYIQTKMNNINTIYELLKHNNNSQINSNQIIKSPKTNGKTLRKMRRKLKVKNNKKNKRKKKNRKYDENNEVKENEMDENNSTNNSNLSDEYKRIIKVINISNDIQIKRIYELTLDGLLPEYNCYIRARVKNINGWSNYCECIEVINCILQFDINNSSKHESIKYEMNNKCVVFNNTKQHNIIVTDCIIEINKYNIFQWKYTINFEINNNNNNKNGKKNKKKPKYNYEENEGICMGFIGYPLDECMEFTDTQLGRKGTQYGLFVQNESDEAHVYFQRDDCVPYTCLIKLKEKVCSGDTFIIIINMGKGKCDMYHNQFLLHDIFNSKIPKKIIPAISAHIVNGNVKCNVECIASE